MCLPPPVVKLVKLVIVTQCCFAIVTRYESSCRQHFKDEEKRRLEDKTGKRVRVRQKGVFIVFAPVFLIWRKSHF